MYVINPKNETAINAKIPAVQNVVEMPAANVTDFHEIDVTNAQGNVLVSEIHTCRLYVPFHHKTVTIMHQGEIKSEFVISCNRVQNPQHFDGLIVLLNQRVLRYWTLML